MMQAISRMIIQRMIRRQRGFFRPPSPDFLFFFRFRFFVHSFVIFPLLLQEEGVYPQLPVFLDLYLRCSSVFAVPRFERRGSSGPVKSLLCKSAAGPEGLLSPELDDEPPPVPLSSPAGPVPAEGVSAASRLFAAGSSSRPSESALPGLFFLPTGSSAPSAALRHPSASGAEVSLLLKKIPRCSYGERCHDRLSVTETFFPHPEGRPVHRRCLSPDLPPAERRPADRQSTFLPGF